MIFNKSNFQQCKIIADFPRYARRVRAAYNFTPLKISIAEYTQDIQLQCQRKLIY